MDHDEKIRKRKEEKELLESRLETAIQKKVDFEHERIRIDNEILKRKTSLFKNHIKKTMTEYESAEKQFQIINTVVVPPKGTKLDQHLWTEQEAAARRILDEADKQKKIDKGEGKSSHPRLLTEQEKQRLLTKEMRALRFDSHTFYEDNPEWFAFETRLRDMMLSMLEPIIRKSLHDTTHVAKVMNNQDYQKGKVDEFEFLV